MQFCTTVIRPTSPLWHPTLTSSSEAVQRGTINMILSFLAYLLCFYVGSGWHSIPQARRLDHSEHFLFINICQLITATDCQHVDAFLRRSKRCGFCPPDLPNFDQLLKDADDQLFERILNNPHTHCTSYFMVALCNRSGHIYLLGEEAEASPSIANTLWRV